MTSYYIILHHHVRYSTDEADQVIRLAVGGVATVYCMTSPNIVTREMFHKHGRFTELNFHVSCDFQEYRENSRNIYIYTSFV